MGKGTNQIATFNDLQTIGYRIPSAITDLNHCVTYGDFTTMNNETNLAYKTKVSLNYNSSITNKLIKWSDVPASTPVAFTGNNSSQNWNTLTSVPITFAANGYSTYSMGRTVNTETELCRIWIYRVGRISTPHQLVVLYLTNQNPEQTIYLPINLAIMNSNYANEFLKFRIESTRNYTAYSNVKLTTKNGLDIAEGPDVSFAIYTAHLNQDLSDYTKCIQQLYRVDIYQNEFTI